TRRSSDLESSLHAPLQTRAPVHLQGPPAIVVHGPLAHPRTTIAGATWACAVVTSVARASSRRPTFSHPGVAPAPRIRETTAAAAVGPTGLTNPIVATGLTSPSIVTGPTGPSIATGLTNPITGTSPVVWTGPRRPPRHRSAERPRRGARAPARRPPPPDPRAQPPP